jgi:putative ABC transport system substrate-binding protein
LGYVEGQSVDIEYRTAEGDIGRLPGLAAELAALQVDVFVTGGPVPTEAAKAVTTTIPIVVVGIPDPISDGFVPDLAHPDGNITGLSSLETLLSGKRLELLQLAAPTASRVAVLWNATTPGMAQRWRETRDAAGMLGMYLVSVDVQGLASAEDLFVLAARENVNALVVWRTTFAIAHASRLVAVASQSRLPTMYDGRSFVDAGGLMSYDADNRQLWRRAAYYVDRILKGAKPADLPVEQPMTFEFVVNLRTAQALGITFPNEIMLQVTEVIE